jgi:hypothetical protein
MDAWLLLLLGMLLWLYTGLYTGLYGAPPPSLLPAWQDSWRARAEMPPPAELLCFEVRSGTTSSLHGRSHRGESAATDTAAGRLAR